LAQEGIERAATAGGGTYRLHERQRPCTRVARGAHRQPRLIGEHAYK
jgi:hypothetical protein